MQRACPDSDFPLGSSIESVASAYSGRDRTECCLASRMLLGFQNAACCCGMTAKQWSLVIWYSCPSQGYPLKGCLCNWGDIGSVICLYKSLSRRRSFVFLIKSPWLVMSRNSTPCTSVSHSPKGKHFVSLTELGFLSVWTILLCMCSHGAHSNKQSFTPSTSSSSLACSPFF